MIKFVDYTSDAELKASEIDDFDTTDWAEGYEHPTGINEDRMHLPTRYDIRKFYARQKRNRERGVWKNRRTLPDISEDFDWQITYKFPATLRNSKTESGGRYGARHVTYRRLYLILCERFNGGRYFVDDYFDSVYPHTIKPEIDAYLKDAKRFILNLGSDVLEGAVPTVKGSLDRRRKANRGMEEKLQKFERYKEQFEARFGDVIAERIREDIISCLASGQIPLEFQGFTEGTLEARRKAGIPEGNPEFFATSRLINHIQLFVKIGGNKQWQTRQGILV